MVRVCQKQYRHSGGALEAPVLRRPGSMIPARSIGLCQKPCDRKKTRKPSHLGWLSGGADGSRPRRLHHPSRSPFDYGLHSLPWYPVGHELRHQGIRPEWVRAILRNYPAGSSSLPALARMVLQELSCSSSPPCSTESSIHCNNLPFVVSYPYGIRETDGDRG
jgi:hypothetical protein